MDHLTESEKKTLTELIDALMEVPEEVHSRLLGYAQAIIDYNMFKEERTA